jgi:GDPmannose 4,6-dehydratase
VKRVAVVGSAGQDGRILHARLLEDGHDVFCITRDSSSVNIAHAEGVRAFVEDWKPEEVYYLAGYHHSSQDRISVETLALMQQSFAVHVHGCLHFLEAIRCSGAGTRFFYAASSHIFGDASGELQNEQTPLQPDSPYAISKTAGVHCCRLYRGQHGVFASVGILYNHESPYRQEKFVSQKIIRAVLRISRGEQTKLVLGNLSARIDWGYAPDFIDAMIRILQADRADDFVIATGETHSVGEFVEIAFALLGLDWRAHVEEDRALLHRTKAPMAGDSSKLRAITGWKPSVSFAELVEILLRQAQKDGF